MGFAEIRKTVEDAWNFCWPPLVAIVIALVILRLVYPGSNDLVQAAMNALRNGSNSVNRLRGLLAPYGLSKLIPLLLLIALTAALFIINNVLLGGAAKLPPYLSLQPEVLLQDRMRDEEKLLLFRTHPTAENLNAAYSMALEDLGERREPRYSGAGAYYMMIKFEKFALACVVLAFLVAARNHAGFVAALRSIPILLILFIIWALTFVGLLYETEQDLGRTWNTVRVSLQPKADDILSPPMTAVEKNKIDSRASGQWWHLYLFDTYKISWFKRTFLETNTFRVRRPRDSHGGA